MGKTAGRLYANDGGFQTLFARWWSSMARQFKTHDNILAHAILNEPWLGDV